MPPREKASAMTRCPCTGVTLDKLLHPAILTVLAREDLHGYRLAQRVAELPVLNGVRPDMTGLYRCLKSLQKRGFVSSSWDLPDAGPAKRRHALTPEGRECLSMWIATLEKYQEA